MSNPLDVLVEVKVMTPRDDIDPSLVTVTKACPGVVEPE